MNRILTNHFGYEAKGSKQAVIQTQAGLDVSPVLFIDCRSQQIIAERNANAVGAIDNWQQGYFYQVDFSDIQQSGEFILQTTVGGQTVQSHPVRIGERLQAVDLISDLAFYFKSQRCSGRFDFADRTAPLFNDPKGRTVDVHGGWYDASGDTSKYLSHLSYANFMNPQQTPLIVWSAIKSHDRLAARQDDVVYRNLRWRLADEALWGADFLMRLQADDGYFYMTVFDNWSKDPKRRTICEYATQQGNKFDTYQAAFRQGGGLTIAALALASTLPEEGEYSAQQYLQAARKGYQHLREYNSQYCNDGQENLIDEYCALSAVTALYQVTQEQQYLSEARLWAARVAKRFNGRYWLVNDAGRPYFHAAEAGLPVLALLDYLSIDNNPQIRELTQQAVLAEVALAQQVPNAFGLARQVVQPLNGDIRDSFFVPHQNESGYWWQGENARLGSLAAMAFAAAQALPFDRDEQQQVLTYARNQMNWVLGLNPFDSCQLHGRGHNNPYYIDGYPQAYGGICNGITADFDDQGGIALCPEPYQQDFLQNWRWGEQWIPHGGWFLLALANDPVLNVEA